MPTEFLMFILKNGHVILLKRKTHCTHFAIPHKYL